MNNNNYLILNKNKIKYISGPVSFSLLTPINNNFPIIILFGDIHYSSKNICKKCISNHNCYNLHDDIINIFNNISNENNKIDIYLEHDFIHLKNKPSNENINNNIQLIPLLVNNIYNCYDIDKKNNNCNYNNIRWHYVNLRKFVDNDFVIMYFIDFLYNLMNKNKKTYHNFILIKYKYILFNIIYFKKIIKLLYLAFKNKYQFIKFYYNLIINNNIINKQINKINLDTNFIKNSIYEYIIYFYDKYIISDININNLNFKDIKYILKKIYKIYSNFNDYDIINNYIKKLNNYKSIYKYIYNLIINIRTIILDIYYILRTLKMKKYNSIISIGIFGDFHTINIIHYFTFIFNKYKLLYSININNTNNNYNRCLEINKNIDLDNILSLYQ